MLYIQVLAEIPGCKKEDITINLDNNLLTITAEKKKVVEEGDDKSTWHRTERSYGRTTRSVRLPQDASQEEVRATYDNGVLSVEVQKVDEAQRSAKKIDIQ